MTDLGALLHGAGPRVPLVLQAEAAECGLACLAMVAGAHGLVTDLPTLRQRFAVSVKGVTLADIVRMADALQLDSRALRAEPADLAALRLPCILHWDMNHFVVLVSVRRGVALIHDPAFGERRMTLGELSPHFTGVALELTPAHGFTPAVQRQRVRVRQLLGPVTGLRRSLLQIGALALVLEAFVLLSPFFMQWVVDAVLPSADADLLLVLGAGFALLVVLQVASAAARGWAVLVLSTQLNLQWLSQVFAHLMRLPLGWFEKRHAGDVWSRFNAVQTIQKTLTTDFVEAVLDGLMVVLVLAVMWVYSPLLSAVALVAVGLYGALRWALFAPLRRRSEEALVFEARQASHFLESLRGVQAIKLFNAQGQRHTRFAALVGQTLGAEVGVRRLELLASVLHRGLFGMERVAVVWMGAHLVMTQQLSLGMLFAFFAFREQFTQRTAALVDKAVTLQMLKLQGERLADIVLAAPERDSAGEPVHRPADQTSAKAPTPAALPPTATVAGEAGAPVARPAPPATGPRAVDGAASIELREVHFRYGDGEAPVLQGVSLRIEPGESVAIIGPSGCGKTTLLKLMLGLHAPTQGEVWVDGMPLSQRGLRQWRAQVGVVMQEEPLFTGSIAENITFFDPQPDLTWAHRCAQLAAVQDDIESMPMGWQTLVADMGAALSGGQKQRILLARALYRRPRMLLLDEATSSLDVERERAINQAIRQLPLTRVIVAHRPDTIASASRVIALHEGRVAQNLRSVPSAAPMQ
jgi:ATP-binding cassette subfamily B protein RaxB